MERFFLHHNNGQKEYLKLWQDSAPGVSGSNSFTAENKEVITLVKGTVVTQHVSGVGIVRADADTPSAYAVGLLGEDVPAAVSGIIICSGVLLLPDWTAITGAATLAAKGKYYLDTAAGLLTTTPPNIGGKISQLVGVAISSVELEIKLAYPILL